MGTFEGELDFTSYRDEYQEGLRGIIDAKIEGREIVRAGSRSAAQGRELDGGVAEEPRRRERRARRKRPRCGSRQNASARGPKVEVGSR